MNQLATAFSIAAAYLREKKLATALNVLLLGLGVGTIIALVLLLAQAEDRMERDSAGIDLVIGAKGSPMQLILSSVFQVDIPTGNPSRRCRPHHFIPHGETCCTTRAWG
jgi:putative ABC transport system permease protein